MANIKINVNADDAVKNVDNLNKSLGNTVKGVQQTERSMREMRNELKDLQKQMEIASKAGDAAGFKNLQARFVELKNDMADTKSAMQFLDPGALLGGWVSLAQGIGGAFATATGALTLFGASQEDVQEIQKKSVAIIQTMIGLEEFRSKLIDDGALKNIKSLYASTKAYLVQNLTIKATEGSTKSLTAVQLLWNKAVAANPIMILVAAVAALAAGVVYLITQEEKYNREKEKTKEIDASILNIKNETAKGMATELSHLAVLMAKYEDVNTTSKERKDIIKDINKNYSDLIGYEVKENDTLKDLKKTYDDIVAVLYKKYQTQAVEKELVQLFEKRTKLQIQLNQLEAGGLTNMAKLEELRTQREKFLSEGNMQEVLRVQAQIDELEKLSKTNVSATNLAKTYRNEIAVLDDQVKSLTSTFQDYLIVITDDGKKDDIIRTKIEDIQKLLPFQVKLLQQTEKVNDEIVLSEEDQLTKQKDILAKRLLAEQEYSESEEEELNKRWEKGEVGWKEYEDKKLEITKKANEERIENEYATLNAIGDALNELGNIIGEETRAGAIAQRAAALFKLSIDTAQAISGLTANSETNPANALTFGGAGMVQFATGMVRILANIASARKMLTQPLPKFATGGMIFGPGTGTSDSINAKLSTGEAVINSRSMAVPAFRNIASAINVAGGGKSFPGTSNSPLIDYDLLASKINDKRVVVLESDITKTQKKVKVTERKTTLG